MPMRSVNGDNTQDMGLFGCVLIRFLVRLWMYVVTHIHPKTELLHAVYKNHEKSGRPCQRTELF